MTGGTPTTLVSFIGSSGTNPGTYPNCTLTPVGGTFYGTTWSGGDYNDGEIFSVPLAGGAPTVLFSFNGADGKDPRGGLTLCGSTLYGETESGGASGDGTIFSIPVTGGTPATLSLLRRRRRSDSDRFLTFSGPTLYGMTLGGGGGSLGTIFALMVFGPGDANGDGQVHVNDLTIVLSNFGQTGCSWAQGCMDGDPTGTVDVNDLTIVLSNFGRSFGSAAAAVAAVPEPSVAVLAVAGLGGPRGAGLAKEEVP